MVAGFRRLLFLLRRSRHEAELREEMETHRALRQAALERGGMAADCAAAASRRALGNLTLAAEEARDVWAVRLVDTALQDLRTAGRGLRKSPGFTAVAVAILALGIGANTAIFSIFNSLILRPLPVRDPGSLVLLDGGSWTYPIWRELERDGGIFAGVFAWASEPFDTGRGGTARLVDGAYVSGGMFQVLGAAAAMGRPLLPADDETPANAAVAVISHRFWLEYFAGASDVIGRPIALERRIFTVVGVMPPAFLGPDVGQRIDVMVPFAAEPLLRGADSMLDERSAWWIEVMARRRPGQSIAAATAALRGIQPLIRAATLPPGSADLQAGY